MLLGTHSYTVGHDGNTIIRIQLMIFFVLLLWLPKITARPTNDSLIEVRSSTTKLEK